MQHPTSEVPSSGYVPTFVGKFSRDTVRRAQGLRGLCVCELLCSIWGIVFSQWIIFAVFIPVDIIGIIAATKMNKVMLGVFSFLKAMMLFLSVILFCDIITNYATCSNNDYCSVSSDTPATFIFLAAIVISQIVCLGLAVNIRKAIILADTESSAELNSVDNQFPSMQMYPMQQMQQMQQMQPMHTQHMQPLPQHIQDPHANAGVPGYPYPPPQYYPMYMNQQGFPMPYSHYPHSPVPQQQQQTQVSPVSTYPAFTISQEQPQTNDNQPLLREGEQHNLL